MYRETGAMALLLQSYVGASNAEAVELTVVDLRWQMVLDCLGVSGQHLLLSGGARMIDGSRSN